MAQKEATAHKMKCDTRQPPRPNCDSDGKADNKRQAFSKHRLEVLGSLSNYDDDHNDDFKKQ